jgi:hypothetical protein
MELYPILAVGNSVQIAPAWYHSIKIADPYDDWHGTIVGRKGLSLVLVQWRGRGITAEHEGNLVNKPEGRDVRMRP